MKKPKIGAGTGWAIVGIAATLVSLIANNKKEASNLDAIAEKAADILEKRTNSNQN